MNIEFRVLSDNDILTVVRFNSKPYTQNSLLFFIIPIS